MNSVLEAHERDFNRNFFYGKDSNPEMILDVCKRYPVMSSYQLVVVREAQHLSKTLSYFENYFKKPVPSTILVFCFKGKKIDKRKSVGKLLSKLNYIYDLDPIKEYQLPDWIISCANENNIKFDRQAIVLFAEFLGNNLSEIEKNIQKLQLLISEGQIVDIDMIQKHIGFSKEYNLFELTDAIAAMNIQKAGFIAYHFGKNNKKSSYCCNHFSFVWFFYQIDEISFL